MRSSCRTNGLLAEPITGHRSPQSPQQLDNPSQPWALRVQTFGCFALERPSGNANDRSRKVQKVPLRLLKCLAAAGGKPLEVSAACDALWPDDDPANARRKLDVTLHRLRKLIGGDAVHLFEGALAIDRSRCFVDAWAFASLAAHAERRLREAIGEASGGEARTWLDQALQLYCGPFLPDDDDLLVVLAQREFLRRRFVHLVLAFGAALERCAPLQAIALYEQAVEIDELAEPISLALMRAYLALDRPADVANAYHRCQLAQQSAFGAPPSQELNSLYHRSCTRLTAARR